MTKSPSKPAPLPDLNAVARALAQAGSGKRISLDTETYDPDLKAKGPGARRGGYMVGVSLAVEGGPGWYLPMRHASGNLDPKKVMGVLRPWARDFTGEVVGAHLLYDLEYLWLDKAGSVQFNRGARFLDVQNAEPLLDEHRYSYALGVLGELHLGRGKDTGRLQEAARRVAVGAIEAKWAINEPQRLLYRVPGAEATPYALEDARLPLEILRKQEPLLRAEELETVFRLETRLIPLLLQMRLNGVRVDVPGALKAQKEIRRKRDALLKELRRMGGPRVELWSTEAFAAYLKQEGVPVPRTPKTDKDSIKKEWLARQTHPGCRMYLAARRYDKADNTFMEGHILGSEIGGRVYPQWNQLKSDDSGTISGRFSCSNPNLQQLSKRDPELASIVRGAFLPEPGEEWYADDYSQMEYRFLTHYARGRGAEEAREAYRTDPKTSFHKLAAELAGVDVSVQADYLKMKTTNFCKVYGGGAPKIADTAEISLQEAKDFVELYDERLPFVKETCGWMSRVAGERGYVKSVSGRRHRFPFWEPADWKLSKLVVAKGREAMLTETEALITRINTEGAKAVSPDLPENYRPRGGVRRARTHKAANCVFQGGNADAMKEAMAQQYEAGLFDVIKILVSVHDEEGLSVPKTKAAREAADESRRLMQNSVQLQVPVLVERKTGKNWGEASAE